MQVEIISEGDAVNELHIVVAGMVEVLKTGAGERAEDVSLDLDNVSVRNGMQ